MKPANLANASTAVEKMGEAITARILEIMGEGSDERLQLWRKTLSKWTANGLPYNADNGRQYSGGNIMQLMVVRMDRGFESNGWITYGNMVKRGFTIKKGCKAPWAWVLSPRMAFDKKDKDGNKVKNADGSDAKVMGPQRAYKVFNMDCIETHGKPVPGRKHNPATTEPDYGAASDILTHHNPALFFDGGDRAFYRPRADTIHLPAKSSFTNDKAYYHVLLHEMSHWTGHETRLDRKLLEQGGFGSEGYAFEELIAELSSAFTMARLNMGDSQMPAHASYLKSWIKALKGDKLFILKASTQASKACQFLTACLDAAEPEEVEEDVPEAAEPVPQA